MQDEENLTKEQIEEEIKKIKEANAEDEGMGLLFPCDVNMPLFEHDIWTDLTLVSLTVPIGCSLHISYYDCQLSNYVWNTVSLQ